MSDWKKRNEDWRDEDELEEEEECECPWVDSKGKVRETAYCQYLLEKHPMMCLKQKLFDQNGEVDEDALLYEVHSDLRDFVLDNLAKKEKQVLDALRIETYTPEWKPQLDRIHLQNGTYFLDERGFVPEKELCLNRLPVEYQPDAPAPTKWLEFLGGLLIPEDILTLQEYLGYSCGQPHMYLGRRFDNFNKHVHVNLFRCYPFCIFFCLFLRGKYILNCFAFLCNFMYQFYRMACEYYSAFLSGAWFF